MSDSYDKVRENEVVSKASNRALILNDIDNSFGWTLAWMWPEKAKQLYPKYLHVLTNRALQNVGNVDSENWEGGVKELKQALRVESMKSQAALSSGIALLKKTIRECSNDKFHSSDPEGSIITRGSSAPLLQSQMLTQTLDSSSGFATPGSLALLQTQMLTSLEQKLNRLEDRMSEMHKLMMQNR